MVRADLVPRTETQTMNPESHDIRPSWLSEMKMRMVSLKQQMSQVLKKYD